MAAHYIIAILTLLAPLLASAAVNNGDPTGTPVGTWHPLNVTEPIVTEIAKNAVETYARENKKQLTFVEVIKGESQVQSGVLYKLLIKATGKTTDDYLAVVLSKGSVSRKLISFTRFLKV